MLVAQGNLPEALKSLPRRAGDQRASGEGRPRQRRLAARSVGVLQQGRRRAGGAGQSAGGAEVATATGWRSATVWRRPTPATPAGSAICRCRYEQSRRRAGGAGQSAGGAEILPRRAGDQRPLAKADPGNAGWQRDLSVSYNKIGDVLVAQGNLPEALKSLPRRARDHRPSGEGRPRQRRLAARSVGVATTGSATCWWRRAICRRR